MGYSTTFRLSWTPTTWGPTPLCSHVKAPDAKFCATCGKPNVCTSLDSLVGSYIEDHETMQYALKPDGSTSESCKWYDAVDDIGIMSQAIRGVIFHLEGEGEDAGDIWDAFALDGATQRHAAKIVRVTEPVGWILAKKPGDAP